MTSRKTDAQAATRLLEALDRQHLFTRGLDDEARARIAVQMPTAEEAASDRWNDE